MPISADNLTSITWQAIADRIGISVVTLWRWRTRRGGPTKEQEERIREAVRSILREGGGSHDTNSL